MRDCCLVCVVVGYGVIARFVVCFVLLPFACSFVWMLCVLLLFCVVILFCCLHVSDVLFACCMFVVFVVLCLLMLFVLCWFV